MHADSLGERVVPRPPGYIGLYLVDLQLPALVNAGPAELYITTDGQESNRVRVYLEP